MSRPTCAGGARAPPRHRAEVSPPPGGAGPRQTTVERLVAGWGLLADLCFADLLLFAPGRDGGLVVAGRAQAADEEHVRVLVERVQADELRGVPRRVPGLAPGEEREGGLVQHGARDSRDVPPLALEP